MAGDESVPLLADSTNAASSQRSPSQSSDGSRKPSGKRRARNYELSSESSPLLSRHGSELPRYVDEPPDDGSASSSLDQPLGKREDRIRWPSFIAFLGLSLATIAILCLGFATPSVIKQYAQQAAVFEPSALSIASFTPSGVQARVQGSFVLDASRVNSHPVRNLGRMGTWLVKEVESGQSDVEVYLPEYGNILVATARVPPIKVNVRNGHFNEIDFLVNLAAGDVDGVRGVANDWLQGRLGQLRVKAVADVQLKSGVFTLGHQTISEALTFQDRDLPSFPELNITKLNVHEVTMPKHKKKMVADVSAVVSNDYAVNVTIPPLGFDILVPNCSPEDDFILVANATTKWVDIVPRSPVAVTVTALFQQLSDALTRICPGTHSSPLDLLVSNYVQGNETTIYVRGAEVQSPSMPTWAGDFLKSVTVPVPFTGHEFEHLVKNFSMTNVHVYLPEPFAEPDTPEAQPKVSALVKAIIGLPKQMDFPLNISRVRSTADIFYKDEKLGYIDLHEWQRANATRVEEGSPPSPELLVEFDIKKAPLQVTNESAFSDVVQALLFGKKPIALNVSANVDAETDTALGKFVIRRIPASGSVVVKPPVGGGLGDLRPEIESVKILRTTESSVLVQARCNFTNPTNYSANVPFVDVHLLHNNVIVGHVTGRDLAIGPGVNSGIELEGLYSPRESGGEEGVKAGRDLLSKYVSGLNATVSLRSHEGTVPAVPGVGRSLSKLSLEMQIPSLRAPGGDHGNGDDDKPSFIRDATMHLWSSTAVFTLLSPLPATTLFVTSVDATAFYNHTDRVGSIQYDLPFAVPPGVSQTPRLPVDLDLGGTGYEALKNALGGTLKLDAIANIGAKLGEYSDIIIYKGEGIGAKVRI